MSRVDQALRQANHAALLEPPAETAAPGLAGHTGQPLDLYLPEPAVDGGATPIDTYIASSGPATARRTTFDSALTHAGRRANADKLVTGGALPLFAVEQYRRLAAALHHLQEDQGLCTLTVTSAVPREGKTLTVVNLALTLSESYNRRVLLIDADLRRPSVHDVFGIARAPGLCDTLRSSPAAPRTTAVSPTLSVLPAGLLRGDPMEALASEQMARLLVDAASSFEWVLLDAPPVAQMADAGLLVRLTRAVLLVIGANSTPYKVVESVVGEIGREHIVGTVLNRVEPHVEGWSAYYADDGTRRGRSRESITRTQP